MRTDLRRFGKSSSTKAMTLAADHPAVTEARPLFAVSANEHKRHLSHVLVSGHNSRKIGKFITKGAWKDFPIFTLTLEERATCPTTCELWRGCYGNRMPWSLRYAAGAETEDRIEAELTALQRDYRGGFVVRLHVLGDFYSVEYVERWKWWLARFPALHVFGYTAREASDPIGVAVEALALADWSRFAIRSSGRRLALPAAVVNGDVGVTCPAETDQSECCGTCALCWSAPNKTIRFEEH